MQHEERLERLKELPPAKRASLLKKFAQQKKERGRVPTIQPGSQQSPAALSFALQQLFYLYLLDPTNSVYNLPIALHMFGTLDVSVLMESINTIIRRHEILRTTIILIDGKPVQSVDPDFVFTPRIVDASAYKRDELAQAIADELSAPFNLLRGPLIRVSLFIVGATEHVLLLNMPHIVSDGWSMGVLLGELNSIYTALIQGRSCPLAELSIQYADYAIWQRDWLQGSVLDNHLSYWREYLAGVPTLLDLPTDYPRPVVQRYRGGSLTFQVPEDLRKALRQLSQAEEGTLFMTLLAAFQVLLYPAFAQGQPSPLPELEIQYADYSEWQRERLQGQEKERLLKYWKQQMQGLSPLELPTDRPRPPFFSYRGGHVPFEISAPLTKKLQELSRQEKVTLFMTLQTAFQTVLARYSGLEDIAVGSPIAGRTQTELEELIGFFANTLVLRADLSGNPSFRTALERVRTSLLGAYAHQELPFEQLVEELRLPRDPSRNPLFQGMFVFQNTPPLQANIPGLSLDVRESYVGTATFDLLLLLTERDGKLEGLFEYSTDLFEEATIRRLIGHYQRVLESVVADPEQAIGAIPLLTAAEREQLVEHWNQTQTPYPPVRCLHELIEEQVERHPEGIALEAEGERMSYRHLNERANQLAHHLQRLGIKPGKQVGVYLKRSAEAIVALLAILKAGAAYVPIDPSNPADRVAYMLENAAISVLLTQEQVVERVPAQGQVHLVRLDRDWPLIAQEASSNPQSGVSVDDLFYVIYTSGSTGKPKGVAMSHRALYNLQAGQLQTMVPPRAARFLQYASLSFDVSFQEIFPTLIAGGTILLISEELRRDPQALLRFISQERVEKLYLPMVALQQLADAASGMPEVELSGLREITAAGEQLRITSQVVTFFQRASNCTLHNFYGPTETHGVTIYSLQGEPQQWPTLVPIGRPIANDEVYILDPRGEPVPIGVSGELYLAGVGVAQGYLKRAELTAERFVPDPFSQRAGARMYRSGDLARWNNEGEIEFLGRIDQQVKVRGFRVELEEIEAVLNQHGGVRENVVILREDVPGDKWLVAYLVVEEGRVAGVSELRALVQEHLPEYMHPAHYVFLPGLPLTLNRKIDRKRLPAPDLSRQERQREYVAASTGTEEELVRIWGEVLHMQQIGVEDNFFELGGHSLLVTQVVSRVRMQFGVEMTVQKLFTFPTIRQFAKHVDELLLANIDESNIDDLLASLDGIDDAEAERILQEYAQSNE